MFAFAYPYSLGKKPGDLVFCLSLKWRRWGGLEVSCSEKKKEKEIAGSGDFLLNCSQRHLIACLCLFLLKTLDTLKNLISSDNIGTMCYFRRKILKSMLMMQNLTNLDCSHLHKNKAYIHVSLHMFPCTVLETQPVCLSCLGNSFVD